MADREKVTTVRLDMDLYEQVALIARVEGRNYSDAMREALVAFVEARRSDPEFMGRLRSQIERDHEVLRQLGSEPEATT